MCSSGVYGCRARYSSQAAWRALIKRDSGRSESLVVVKYHIVFGMGCNGMDRE